MNEAEAGDIGQLIIALRRNSHLADTTSVRLKPDTTFVRLKPDTTYELESSSWPVSLCE